MTRSSFRCRTAENDLATLITTTRAQLNDPVGCRDQIPVMLHNQNRETGSNVAFIGPPDASRWRASVSQLARRHRRSTLFWAVARGQFVWREPAET